MGQLVLEKDQVYSLKVTNIERTEKMVAKKDGTTRRRFNISLEDKKGNTCVAESLCIDENECGYELNVYQFIRVGFVTTWGTAEIEPTDEEGKAQRIVLPMHKSQDKSFIPQGNQERHEPNQYSVLLSGKAITFATGYAKDLKVKEMEIWSEQRKEKGITEEDIKDIARWAATICSDMVDKVIF